MLRRSVLFLLGAALMATGSAVASSDYPNRQITVVYPYAVGSIPEAILRTITEELSQKLGQPVIIEAKPGGAASVGSSFVARAKPDGYTLLFGDSGGSYALNSLRPNAQYNALEDFAFITQAASGATFLVVAPDSPYKTLQELLGAARDGKRLLYGSNGVGSAFHLSVERLLLATDTPNVTHIPYKGSPETNRALLGGEIHFALNAGLGNISAGRAKPLAVASVDRFPLLPDVPTVSEAVDIEYSSEGWWTLAAPAGTPPEIISKLNGAVSEIVNNPDFRKKYTELGFTIESGTPEDAQKLIQTTYQDWKSLLARLNITLP